MTPRYPLQTRPSGILGVISCHQRLAAQVRRTPFATLARIICAHPVEARERGWIPPQLDILKGSVTTAQHLSTNDFSVMVAHTLRDSGFTPQILHPQVHAHSLWLGWSCLYCTQYILTRSSEEKNVCVCFSTYVLAPAARWTPSYNCAESHARLMDGTSLHNLRVGGAPDGGRSGKLARNLGIPQSSLSRGSACLMFWGVCGHALCKIKESRGYDSGNCQGCARYSLAHYIHHLTLGAQNRHPQCHFGKRLATCHFRNLSQAAAFAPLPPSARLGDCQGPARLP